MSQTKQILAYLRKGKKLTVLSALTRFGVYALSQRCGELQRAGYPIESHTIKLKNGKRISEYFLKK